MNQPFAPRPTVESLSDRPESILDLTLVEMFAIPLEEQKAIQLAGARKRFHQLREGVSMLARLADEQGITEINTLEDLGPLLIPHSAMKSYPMTFLEKGQFDRLTRWLNGFTTHDLSG